MPITLNRAHFSTDDFRVYVKVPSIVPGTTVSLIVTPDAISMHHGQRNTTIVVKITKDNKYYENIAENLKNADKKLALCCSGVRLYDRTNNYYYDISVKNIYEYPVDGLIEIIGSISNDCWKDAFLIDEAKNRINYTVVLPKITKVAYNFPATIVWWSDGTKTVVKMTESDRWLEFDKEVGLSMAISRKYLELLGYSNVRSAFKSFVNEADVYSLHF